MLSKRLALRPSSQQALSQRSSVPSPLLRLLHSHLSSTSHKTVLWRRPTFPRLHLTTLSTSTSSTPISLRALSAQVAPAITVSLFPPSVKSLPTTVHPTSALFPLRPCLSQLRRLPPSLLAASTSSFLLSNPPHFSLYSTTPLPPYHTLPSTPALTTHLCPTLTSP